MLRKVLELKRRWPLPFVSVNFYLCLRRVSYYSWCLKPKSIKSYTWMGVKLGLCSLKPQLSVSDSDNNNSRVWIWMNFWELLRDAMHIVDEFPWVTGPDPIVESKIDRTNLETAELIKWIKYIYGPLGVCKINRGAQNLPRRHFIHSAAPHAWTIRGHTGW